MENMDYNLPIALRRKRRSSSSHNGKPTTLAEGIQGQHGTQHATSLTPRKDKKRVRFSDPGPDMASSSTGLTPAIRRHTLTPVSPSPSAKSAKLNRRRSMPAIPSMADSLSIGTIQFEPLRQILDSRVQRRLKRNHLSEELNSIDAAKKDQVKRRKDEIGQLRDQVKAKDEEVRGLRDELEVAKQRARDSGLPADEQSSLYKISRLETEVLHLREEMQAWEAPDQEDDRESTPETRSATTVDDENEDGFLLNSLDDFDANMTDIRESSPCRGHNGSLSLPANIPADLLSNGTQAAEEARNVHLEEQIQVLRVSMQELTATQELANTTRQRLLAKLDSFIPSTNSQSSDDGSALDAALDSVLTALVLAQSTSEDAQAAFSYLSAELSQLGFPGENADVMLKAIQEQFRRARLELEYLQPGETVEGFENSKLLDLLVDRVRALLHRVKRGEHEVAGLKRKDEDAQAQLKSTRSKEYAAERRAILAEQHWTATKAKQQTAESKLKDLEAEIDEKERSVVKLQCALEGYRKEVKGLESLVTRLEVGHDEALKQLRNEKDEAVADLDDKLSVAAERAQAAQSKAEERAALVQALEERVNQASACTAHVQSELQSLLAAKEAIIARLQSEMSSNARTHSTSLAAKDAEIDAQQAALTTKDALIDGLECQVLELRTSLSTANASLNALECSKSSLQARLEAEAAAGARAVEAMQSELMRAIARAGEVKNGFLSSREHTPDMPATPQSMSRFGSSMTPESRKRGKRRRFDSGIGVLEEDENEFLAEV